MFSRSAALTACLLLAMGATMAIAFSFGPPPGRSATPALGGRPAESLCTGCHTTFAPDLPGAALEILGVPEGYIPDQVYVLSVRLSSSFAAPRRWGFQLTAIAEASGDSAGSFAPLSAATQVISGGTTFPTRQYIEHTGAGTFPNTDGPQTWTFQWKAPPADVGRVLFFGSGNAANNNDNVTGDHIYTARDTSEFSSTTDVPRAPLAGLLLLAGPNPARGPLAVTFELPRRADVSVAVYDATGRVVRSLAQGPREAGRHAVTWDGRLAQGERAPVGVYFVRLAVEGHALARKVTLAD